MKTFRVNLWTILTLIVVCVAFLVFLYQSCFHAAQFAAATRAVKALIILDAGHGGEDGGATGHSPVPEKVLNLAITQKLEKRLMESGCRVLMTRSSDVMLGDNSLSTLRERKASDIHKRAAILQANPGCIFVSIHQNHFSDGIYSGAQVFYSKNNPISAVLAEQIRQSIVANVQPENKRKNKAATRSIYLLAHAQDPAVLVECGFLSNDSEAQMLNDNQYQQKMADAISHGVLQFVQQKNTVSSAGQDSSGGLYSSVASAIMK